jgi:hypothetical protein
MEPEGSIPNSQEISTSCYPEPDTWKVSSKKFILANINISIGKMEGEL